MNAPTRVGALAAAIVMMVIGAGRSALSLENSALEQIASTYESKVFTLKVDLHEPDNSGESMQAPTLEKKGWHHHNPTGPVVLKAGTRVEVTGVFNYSERGLFLELAKEQPGASREDLAARPRCRIRIMVETLPADPAAQQQEASELLGKVLDAASNP